MTRCVQLPSSPFVFHAGDGGAAERRVRASEQQLETVGARAWQTNTRALPPRDAPRKAAAATPPVVGLYDNGPDSPFSV
jgi:hypothetical protein